MWHVTQSSHKLYTTNPLYDLRQANLKNIMFKYPKPFTFDSSHHLPRTPHSFLFPPSSSCRFLLDQPLFVVPSNPCGWTQPPSSSWPSVSSFGLGLEATPRGGPDPSHGLPPARPSALPSDSSDWSDSRVPPSERFLHHANKDVGRCWIRANVAEPADVFTKLAEKI